MDAIKETEARARVVAIARTWLNTPFVDGAGLKGAGVDCGHLVARVHEEAGLLPHKDLWYSTADLGQCAYDAYLNLLLEVGREVAEEEIKPGDIVLYKLSRGSFVHAGIIERWPDSIINALRPHGVLCLSANDGFLQRCKRRFFTIVGKVAS